MAPNALKLDADAVIDPKLKEKIRYLGRLLGEVIQEYEPDQVFESIELLRKGFIEQRKIADEDAQAELLSHIAALDAKTLTKVIRGFSIYFLLNNIAEENNQYLTRQITQNDGSYWSGSFLDTLKHFKADGQSANDVQTLLNSLDYRPVFTAHPTESKRRTILESLQRIYQCCNELDKSDMSIAERGEIHSRLKALIQILWKTDDVRSQKPSVRWEVETTLYYYRETLFKTVPTVYRNLERAIAEIYPNDKVDEKLRVPSFLRFGSWVGGDRDGNPNVTPSTVRQALRMQSREVLKEYIDRVAYLGHILTHSNKMCEFSEALKTSLTKEQLIARVAFADQDYQYLDEPYRRKLGIMQYRLQCNLQLAEQRLAGYTQQLNTHAYLNESEFLADLNLIRDSLYANGDANLCSGSLRDLIRLTETFGFYLAKLDIRQESTLRSEAVAEILKVAELDDSYLDKDEDARMALLSKHLESGEVIAIKNQLLSDATKDILETFYLMAEMRAEISPEAFGSYVISMTHDASHILEVLFLASAAALVGRDEKNEYFCHISVSPLFETIDDLDRIEIILSALYQSPVYRSLLSVSGNLQEVMLGYSDSCKDGGILASNWQLYQAQKSVMRLADDAGIHCRMFHGRGGSAGRGGGSPLHDAILAQPPSTVRGSIKFTEQGEVLSFKYNYPETSVFQLTMGVTGLMKASVPVKGESVDPEYEQYFDTLQTLVAAGEGVYRQLTDNNEALMQYFYETTPATEIGLLNIGSRPSHRKKKDYSKGSIRAISWVFGWAQSRHCLPAWYGVGSALQAIAKNDTGLKKLKTMYQNWPFFRAVVNNAQLAMAKSELVIAKRYADLCDDNNIKNNIYDMVADEYRLTADYCLTVSGNQYLLEHDTPQAVSLASRDPYLDPINFIQILLLSRYRAEDVSDEEKQQWLNPLLRTINAIANGLRNTG